MRTRARALKTTELLTFSGATKSEQRTTIVGTLRFGWMLATEARSRRVIWRAPDGSPESAGKSWGWENSCE
eukprot:1867163-Alexandrium_andersonii.AAC.1